MTVVAMKILVLHDPVIVTGRVWDYDHVATELEMKDLGWLDTEPMASGRRGRLWWGRDTRPLNLKAELLGAPTGEAHGPALLVALDGFGRPVSIDVHDVLGVASLLLVQELSGRQLPGR